MDGDRITAHLKKSGSFEPETLAYFATKVRPASTVLDIGCYSGLFAILATKLRARVIAFEPFPNNFKRIAENAILNRVAFDLRDAAVSDKDGHADLMYNARLEFTAGASLTRALTPSGKMKVKTVRIDSLSLEDVSVMKIDVERHEPAVLRGARETIEHHRPSLIVEALNDSAKQAVLKELSNYEHVATLDTRNLILEAR
jgi:FkbM family methyltransferase